MRILAMALIGALALGGCREQTAKAPPPPQELTVAATGRYCGMNVLEHPGPKAQIILASTPDQPIWFSSARDAFSFTLLPEEPKDIAAIYVSDMGKAQSWENPGNANWVEARQAVFVIGSSRKGGMGADETVPFSDRQAADKFAAENGGQVLAFNDVPKDYVLGPGGSPGIIAPPDATSAGPGDGAAHSH